MGLAQHIQIQTRTGYAKITLNGDVLLITYYWHQLPIDCVFITFEDVTFIYRDGWNLDNLKKVIRMCEPRKTNDKVKTRGIYHE